MIEFELFETLMTVEELKGMNFERLSKLEKLRVKVLRRPIPMILISQTASSNGKNILEALRKGIFMKKIGFVQVVRIIHNIVSLV